MSIFDYPPARACCGLSADILAAHPVPLRVYRLALLCLLSIAPAAPAHGLGAQCKLRGGRVELEAYYDDDTPAARARVRILDVEGQVAVEGFTDAEGKWSFPRPQPGRYRVVVDAGAGHRTEQNMTIPNQGDVGLGAASTPISEGPSREQFTRFPLVNVLIGLIAILAFGLAAWIGLRQKAESRALPSGQAGDTTPSETAKGQDREEIGGRSSGGGHPAGSRPSDPGGESSGRPGESDRSR